MDYLESMVRVYTQNLIPQLIVLFTSSVGAGKTTAFRMLTGDLSLTSGTAVIAGFDIVADLRKVSFVSNKPYI